MVRVIVRVRVRVRVGGGVRLSRGREGATEVAGVAQASVARDSGSVGLEPHHHPSPWMRGSRIAWRPAGAE